ncbi:hypothetical protein QR680_013957 [Steinernema hermaphroditum]|uniref:Uncharacterized protein n=1 Tax=Steinernema hermaphroditum TaxID=289476 RepID=A0AA39I789_9BILA|nr:hypothetical protein QR680_013957 [Steinernema hermaphroditum]
MKFTILSAVQALHAAIFCLFMQLEYLKSNALFVVIEKVYKSLRKEQQNDEKYSEEDPEILNVGGQKKSCEYKGVRGLRNVKKMDDRVYELFT